MRLKSVATLIIFFLMAIAFKPSFAQTYPCPPLPVPIIGYSYQNYFKSGINAGLNLMHAAPQPFGEGFGQICYFYGPVTGINYSYFPDKRQSDINLDLGYRVLFLRANISPGYSFSHNSGSNFVHVDPSLGIDLLGALQLRGGYSFRSKKIDNEMGSPFIYISFSPYLLNSESISRMQLGVYSEVIKGARKKKRDERKK